MQKGLGTVYIKEVTDVCNESNKIFGNIPQITIGINQLINKKYSLLFRSFKGGK